MTLRTRMVLLAALGGGAAAALGGVAVTSAVGALVAPGALVVWTSVAAFAAGVGAWALLPRLVGPLERAIDAAERLAQDGDFAAEVFDGDADPDAARLMAALARREQHLRQRLEAHERETAPLLTVSERINEGLALIDADGRVRLANPAFRQLAAVKNGVHGRLLAESIRTPAVLDAVQASLASGAAREIECTDPAGTGRTLEVRITPLAGDGGSVKGAILLFYDITRLTALERVRQEFVANVSHELRSPLTSIKAAVETLFEDLDRPLVAGELETHRRLLGIARRQTERMEALLSDLTDLSLIETGAIRLALEPVDAAALAHDVASQLAQAAQRAAVTLEVAMPDPCVVQADRRRLEQILVNLVDNAIKFNKPGGRVSVRADRHESRIRISVEDTGLGIPSESLPRVTERFYRVDPSRARDLPGTGLGLAIVKHLMRLHDGTLSIASELGHGTRITLEFAAPGERRGPAEVTAPRASDPQRNR